MDNIFKTYNRIVEMVDCSFHRYIYNQIEWNDRMIGIKGARGVGKTTLMLQHINQHFPDRSKALYVSLDNLWFSQHTLSELVEYHYTHGGTHLFLDEVHRYTHNPWPQELKNIYDSYPDYHLCFTGSSLIEIDNAIADLSRRCRLYDLRGLSFREYLIMEGVGDYGVVELEQVLSSHSQIASSVAAKIKVLPHFERYIRHGFYPFYHEMDELGYLNRVEQVISTVIENDIPAVERIEFDTVAKTKQLLMILTERVPFTLNVSMLCGTLGITRNQLLRLMHLLERASIIRQMYTAKSSNFKAMVKPEKILFDNTNIMFALGNKAESGTVRESFVANQLSIKHKLSQPTVGDLNVDGLYILEVGGAGKGFAQISNVPNSYVVADGIEIGAGNKIPLWLFGMLY